MHTFLFSHDTITFSLKYEVYAVFYVTNDCPNFLVIDHWSEVLNGILRRESGKLVTKTTRTQDNSHPRQSFPSQRVARTTRTQDNSYSGQLVPRNLLPWTTRTHVDSYPGHFVPRTTQDDSWPENSYPRKLVTKTVPTQGMSYLRQLIHRYVRLLALAKP